MELLIISFIFLLFTVKTTLLHYIFTIILPGFLFLSLIGIEPKKRFIFAIPASIFISHWPYFTLTRLGMKIPSEYFYIIPIILIVAYIHYKKEELKTATEYLTKISFTGRIKKSTLEMTMLAIIMISIFYYIFSVFINVDAVALTMGAKTVFETEILRDNIIEGSGAIGWSDRWFGGMHMFISYPIISYLLTATESLHIDAWKAHNRGIFLFTFLTGLYLFYFLKELKIDKKIALTAAFISISLPAFVQVNNVIKTTIDLLLIVIFLHALNNILKKNDKANFIILTMTFLAWSMNYYLSVYDMILPTTMFLILYFIISKENTESILSKLKSIFSAGLLALSMSALWTIPYIYGFTSKRFALTTYSEFTRYPLNNLQEFMKWIAKPIEYIATPETQTALKFEIETFTTLTPAMFYLGLIAAIVALIYALREKKIEYAYPIMSIGVLLFITIQLTPLRDIIPAYFAIYGQIYPYLPLAILMSINLGLFMHIISTKTKAHLKVDTVWLVIIITLVILIPTIQYSHNLGQFLRETSVTDRASFDSIYNAVDIYGKGGTFVIFGIYGPGIIPAITKYTSVNAFSGYGYDSHTTLQQYEKRILPFQEGTMDNLLTDNPYYAYNIFKQSNVKVLIFNICQDNGRKAYETLSLDTRFKEVIRSQCIILTTIENPAKAETIALTEILVDNPQDDLSHEVKRHGSHSLLPKLLNNREKAITAILQVPAAEHLHFTAEEFALPIDRYTNIIINRTATKSEIETYLQNNSTVIYFRDDIKIDNPNFHTYKEYPKNSTELNEILENMRIIDTPINAGRKSNTWTFNNNDLTLIKETHYEKWHSNADIIESYLGFMIVDAKGETKITVKQTIWEIIGGIITIIGYLTITALLIKKRNIKNNNIGISNEKEKNQKNRFKKRPKKRKRSRK
ncbi:MAG: hypothetical protein ABIG84_01205 [archaeon]